MPRLGALSPRGSQAEKINEARETWRRNCELRSGSRRAGGRRADPHPLSQAKPAVGTLERGLWPAGSRWKLVAASGCLEQGVSGGHRSQGRAGDPVGAELPVAPGRGLKDTDHGANGAKQGIFWGFCFCCQQTHSVQERGACYVRRRGKKNAGCEAKVTREAETSRSAAATAGSQVQNTGVVCSFAFSREGKKQPASHILGTGLKAMIS